MAKGR
ncbi:tol-pal system protein YbgF, partial [Yersinia pestis PY-25]